MKTRILIPVIITLLLMNIAVATPNTIFLEQGFEDDYDYWSDNRTSTDYAYSGMYSFKPRATDTHTLKLQPFNESDWNNFTFKYYMTSNPQPVLQFQSDSDYSIYIEVLTELRTNNGNWTYRTNSSYVNIGPYCLNKWCEFSLVWDRTTGTSYFYHNDTLKDNYTGTVGYPASIFQDPLSKININRNDGMYIDKWTLSYESENTAPNITSYYPNSTNVSYNVTEPLNLTFNITYIDLENDSTVTWSTGETNITQITRLYDANVSENITVWVNDSDHSDMHTWEVDFLYYPPPPEPPTDLGETGTALFAAFAFVLHLVLLLGAFYVYYLTTRTPELIIKLIGILLMTLSGTLYNITQNVSDLSELATYGTALELVIIGYGVVMTVSILKQLFTKNSISQEDRNR